LIAIFEEAEILEFDEPDGDVVLIYEESSKKHEGNDKHRG
jgi:hypothetical protein